MPESAKQANTKGPRGLPGITACPRTGVGTTPTPVCDRHRGTDRDCPLKPDVPCILRLPQAESWERRPKLELKMRGASGQRHILSGLGGKSEALRTGGNRKRRQ